MKRKLASVLIAVAFGWFGTAAFAEDEAATSTESRRFERACDGVGRVDGYGYHRYVHQWRDHLSHARGD